jgi:hypothetical protein
MDTASSSEIEKVIYSSSYSNPFWSLPLTELQNPQLVHKAEEHLECKRRIFPEFKRALLILLLTFTVFLAAFIDEFDSGEFSTGTQILFYLCPILVIVFFVRISWTIIKSLAPRNAIREQTTAMYRQWLHHVRGENPNLYSQILTWEQNQTQIQLQQRAISIANQQLRQTQSLTRDIRDIQQKLNKRQ